MDDKEFWARIRAKRTAAIAAQQPTCARTDCNEPATETVRTLGYWEKMCNDHAREWPYKASQGWDAAIDLLSHDGAV